jgi:hypothetical protein
MMKVHWLYGDEFFLAGVPSFLWRTQVRVEANEANLRSTPVLNQSSHKEFCQTEPQIRNFFGRGRVVENCCGTSKIDLQNIAEKADARA